MSASRTRSPCGPNANAPGSVVPNRHDTRPDAGSRAQARPADTKATVCDAVTLPSQPLGSGEPSARATPTGVGDTDADADGESDGVGDEVVVAVVHATNRAEHATTAARRANMARQYSSGAPVGSDVDGRYRAAMTSSGMSKFA
jgi:hypothetical protein